MVFSSLTFLLLFLPLTLGLYYAVREIRARNGVLCLCSLVFYAWGEPVWVLLMLFSILSIMASAWRWNDLPVPPDAGCCWGWRCL